MNGHFYCHELGRVVAIKQQALDDRIKKNWIYPGATILFYTDKRQIQLY